MCKLRTSASWRLSIRDVFSTEGDNKGEVINREESYNPGRQNKNDNKDENLQSLTDGPLRMHKAKLWSRPPNGQE